MFVSVGDAQGEIRTLKPLRATDFESPAAIRTVSQRHPAGRCKCNAAKGLPRTLVGGVSHGPRGSRTLFRTVLYGSDARYDPNMTTPSLLRLRRLGWTRRRRRREGLPRFLVARTRLRRRPLLRLGGRWPLFLDGVRSTGGHEYTCLPQDVLGKMAVDQSVITSELDHLDEFGRYQLSFGERTQIIRCGRGMWVPENLPS